MADTINGIGRPKFTMIDANGYLLRGDYDVFPYCNINGLQERYIKDAQYDELESGRIEQIVFGYRAKLILDYSMKLDGVYCKALMEYLNNEIAGGRTLVEPNYNSDPALNSGIIHEVIFTNSEFLVQLLPSAGTFVSMQGIVIELTAVELDSLDWRTTPQSGDTVYFTLDDFTTTI